MYVVFLPDWKIATILILLSISNTYPWSSKSPKEPVGLYIEPVVGVVDEVGKLPEVPKNIGELNLISKGVSEVNNDPATIDNEILVIATEIWSELEAASSVEPPLMVKPFYNKMVKNEDKSDFKKPLEMTTAEYNSVTPKAQIRWVPWNVRGWAVQH